MAKIIRPQRGVIRSIPRSIYLLFGHLRKKSSTVGNDLKSDDDGFLPSSSGIFLRCPHPLSYVD